MKNVHYKNFLLLLLVLFLSASVVCIGIWLAFMPSKKTLQREMTEFYSNDSVYETVTGEIVEISNGNLFRVRITSESPNFTRGLSDVSFLFLVAGGSEWNDEQKYLSFEIGDQISFISSSIHFYNGHYLPIVQLEKDGVVYLDFETGKNNLIMGLSA